MALVIRQSTSNETPDTTLGGSAVSSVSDTGHGSTVTASSAVSNSSDADEKSARWFGFLNVSGERVSVRLKLSWTTDGSANAADDGLGGSGDGSAQFIIEYSLNGGSSWNTVPSATDSASITSPPGGGPDIFDNDNSADIALPNNQDISQVQVRVDYNTSANASGGLGNSGSGSVTATISSIQVEVTTIDSQAIVMM